MNFIRICSTDKMFYPRKQVIWNLGNPVDISVRSKNQLAEMGQNFEKHKEKKWQQVRQSEKKRKLFELFS